MNGSDAFKSLSGTTLSAESSLTRKLLYEEEMVKNSINPRFSMNQSSEHELVYSKCHDASVKIVISQQAVILNNVMSMYFN